MDPESLSGGSGGGGESKLHPQGGEEAGLEEVTSQLFARFLAGMDRELKPYFVHLTTRTFLKRLVRSLVPATKYDDLLAQPDLYSPLVLPFCLASILHFNLKSQQHELPVVSERYLGSSLVLCFGSLAGASLLLNVAWQFSSKNNRSSNTQSVGLDVAVCLAAYSLFGPRARPRAPCLVGRCSPCIWCGLSVYYAL
ncbi:hypothetical protein BASA81_005797 [Batrachochytrium salamandrivorans]|nr:hypothetical protein BASA81_005797 [Batrachochytrium salamandrivorans]